jgi:hypothetical protein
MSAKERNELWPLMADSASSWVPTERLLSRRNGRRIRRAQDREGRLRPKPAVGNAIDSATFNGRSELLARKRGLLKRNNRSTKPTHKTRLPRINDGEPSSDGEFQMPDRRGSRLHLDFDVVAEPIQAIH